MKTMLRRSLAPALTSILLLAGTAAPALGHDQPDGADWLMADWMLLSWFVFFLAGFLVFIVVLKRGLLSNLERDKHYVLEIDEPDYYTPDWARDGTEEETNDSER